MNNLESLIMDLKFIEKKFLQILTLVIVVVILGILIGICITQYIWNATMPEIFGVKEITFWQIVGLLILSNIFLNKSVINNSLI
jgi:hypothetical protein